MKSVRVIKSALVGLVVLCVALRVLAWLVTPILPSVAMLLVVETTACTGPGAMV